MRPTRVCGPAPRLLQALGGGGEPRAQRRLLVLGRSAERVRVLRARHAGSAQAASEEGVPKAPKSRSGPARPLAGLVASEGGAGLPKILRIVFLELQPVT
jgi:hypothetical protein